MGGSLSLSLSENLDDLVQWSFVMLGQTSIKLNTGSSKVAFLSTSFFSLALYFPQLS